MEQLILKSVVNVFQYEELPATVKQLVDSAKDATANSYSPYSQFSVGAALRLEDGTVIKGANQENAAFPVTMCAERSAIFNFHLVACADRPYWRWNNAITMTLSYIFTEQSAFMR